MGFSRQEYWSMLPFSLPGDLPNPGIKPTSLRSSALAGRRFTTSTTWEAILSFLGINLISHPPSPSLLLPYSSYYYIIILLLLYNTIFPLYYYRYYYFHERSEHPYKELVSIAFLNISYCWNGQVVKFTCVLSLGQIPAALTCPCYCC